jgi:2'-5' RNA ligase
VPTIGVSIAVPEPWGNRLQEFRVANGDVQGASIPTHITLVPPVELAPSRMDDVQRHLDAVAAGSPPYRIHLRGSGTFRPVSPVVFVNLVEGISQTEELAWRCRRGPLAVELGYPYHPHVTVAHVPDEALLDRAFDDLAAFDCVFTVTEFHLYVHDDDRGWKATHDHTLTGSSSGISQDPGTTNRRGAR